MYAAVLQFYKKRCVAESTSTALTQCADLIYIIYLFLIRAMNAVFFFVFVVCFQHISVCSKNEAFEDDPRSVVGFGTVHRTFEQMMRPHPFTGQSAAC